MALIAAYARDRSRTEWLSGLLDPFHETAGSPRWTGFVRLTVERPVSTGLVCLEDLAALRDPEGSLLRLHSLFPSLGLVLIESERPDPVLLFHLGRLRFPQLALFPHGGAAPDLLRAVARVSQAGVPAVVSRALGPYLPLREMEVLRRALDGVHRQWGSEEFSATFGYSRPFLSERLKSSGLPSVGHLLLWSRLLHAGLWLGEPGRTGESVSRQLEYANGSVFRRALRTHLGASPSEIVERGGLGYVLAHFMDRCGIERVRPAGVISVA